jgi:hypothetical protein
MHAPIMDEKTRDRIGPRQRKLYGRERQLLYATEAELLNSAAVSETVALCKRHLPPDCDPIHRQRLEAIERLFRQVVVCG